MTGRLVQMATKLRTRKERKDEVRLTVEDEVEDEVEELKMSHQEIAVWIDCQARWLYLCPMIPLIFFASNICCPCCL